MFCALFTGEKVTLHQIYILGISLVDESEPVKNDAHIEIAPGIHAAYELPDEDEVPVSSSDPVDTSVSLEELMAQMKSM